MTSTMEVAESREQLARERWVLLAAVITTSMSFIDATALNVALPILQTDLHATGTELLWIINAYGLPLAALLLLSGAIGDRYGRKLVYVVGIVWFAICSLACGLAPDTRILLAARGLQGIGAALMIPGSLALITATVARRRRGAAIGLWSACSVVATALGPLLGGLFARLGWWRGVFVINLPLAVVALFAVASKGSESRSQIGRPIDLAGGGWSVGGLAALNVGLIELSRRGWHDQAVWIALLIGIGCLTMFVMTERRADAPILPLQLFEIKALRTACLVTLLFYSSLYGMTLFLSLNLIQLQRYDAVSAGLAQLPIMVLVAVMSPWTGRIMDRRGPRGLLLAGPAIAGIGYLSLAVPGITGGPGESWLAFLPSLLLIGLGMGLTAVPLSTTIVNVVPENHTGLASGLNSTLSRLSNVLGVAVLGTIALSVFTQSLTAQMASLPLTESQRAKLLSEAASFGAAKPPAGTSTRLRSEIRHKMDQSFLRAFRAVSCVCAGASWLAAALAGLALRDAFAEESRSDSIGNCEQPQQPSATTMDREMTVSIGVRQDAAD